MIEELAYLAISFSPVILGISKQIFKHDRLAPFFYYCLTAFSLELSHILLAGNGINNHWLANLWLLIEIVLLFIFFMRWCETTVLKKLNCLLAAIALLTWLIFTLINWRSISLPTLIIEHCFIIIVSGALIIQNLDKESPFNSPKFWCLSGLVFFFSVSLLTYSFVNAFHKDYPQWLGQTFEYLIRIANIITYLIYSYAFLCLSKKKI